MFCEQKLYELSLTNWFGITRDQISLEHFYDTALTNLNK